MRARNVDTWQLTSQLRSWIAAGHPVGQHFSANDFTEPKFAGSPVAKRVCRARARRLRCLRCVREDLDEETFQSQLAAESIDAAIARLNPTVAAEDLPDMKSTVPIEVRPIPIDDLYPHVHAATLRTGSASRRAPANLNPPRVAQRPLTSCLQVLCTTLPTILHTYRSFTGSWCRMLGRSCWGCSGSQNGCSSRKGNG